MSRVAELFGEAVDLEPDARAAFLDSACGEDQALRAQVDALLKADDDEFLVEPAINAQERAHLLSTQRAPPIAIGGRLGPYELTEVIGHGSMGWVYRGRHTVLGREVALKLLSTELVRDPAVVARFLAEARVVNEVAHPHVIEVVDFIEQSAPRRVGLVMKLLHGASLSSLLEGQSLDRSQIVEIAAQLVDALAAVHAGGVVHRDLKPGNVFITGEVRQPRVVVLDFGVAKMAERSGYRTATGEVLGTPAYMAPEQLRGGAVSPSADIYAWGLIVLEMLTGTPSFTGSALTVMRAKTAAPSPSVPDMQGIEPICEALRRSLARDPAERPTADSLRRSLQPLREALAPRATRAAEAIDSVERQTDRRVLAGLGRLFEDIDPSDGPAVKRALDRGVQQKRIALSEDSKALTKLLHVASEMYACLGFAKEAAALREEAPASEPLDTER